LKLLQCFSAQEREKPGRDANSVLEEVVQVNRASSHKVDRFGELLGTRRKNPDVGQVSCGLPQEDGLTLDRLDETHVAIRAKDGEDRSGKARSCTDVSDRANGVRQMSS
jgi:hypothetical protein